MIACCGTWSFTNWSFFPLWHGKMAKQRPLLVREALRSIVPVIWHLILKWFCVVLKFMFQSFLKSKGLALFSKTVSLIHTEHVKQALVWCYGLTWRRRVSAARGCAAGSPSSPSPPQTDVSFPPAPCAEPPGSFSFAHDAAAAAQRGEEEKNKNTDREIRSCAP